MQKFNYPVQDLESAEPFIEKMIAKNSRISTIYNFLRREVRWNCIGDYLIVAFIFQIALQKGKIFSSTEVAKTFRRAQDGEFEKVRGHNNLVKQLYA